MKFSTPSDTDTPTALGAVADTRIIISNIENVMVTEFIVRNRLVGCSGYGVFYGHASQPDNPQGRFGRSSDVVADTLATPFGPIPRHRAPPDENLKVGVILPKNESAVDSLFLPIFADLSYAHRTYFCLSGTRA